MQSLLERVSAGPAGPVVAAKTNDSSPVHQDRLTSLAAANAAGSLDSKTLIVNSAAGNGLIGPSQAVPVISQGAEDDGADHDAIQVESDQDGRYYMGCIYLLPLPHPRFSLLTPRPSLSLLPCPSPPLACSPLSPLLPPLLQHIPTPSPPLLIIARTVKYN